MQPLSFFEERIGKSILRGTTIIPVTEKNYKKLHELQNEKDKYLFIALDK